MADEPKRDDPTDFSQFRKPARKIDLAVVDSANESLGYSAPKPSSATPAPQRRLFRTGRNMQLNIKANPDVVRRFIAISDAYEWPSGLTMEHAIGALERELARESRPKGRDAPSSGSRAFMPAMPALLLRPTPVHEGNSALVRVLEASIETLKAENEILRRRLAAAEARAAQEAAKAAGAIAELRALMRLRTWAADLGDGGSAP